MTITRSIILSLLVIGCLCNTSCISKKLTATHSTINKIKDTDGDGVNDADDRCPDIKGVATLAGCPDTDGDGIADNKDKCPEVAGQLRYQGCPVPDSDKDGINDEEDECPTVFGYARYKGCLIPDTDGDGVNDEEDKCINESGPASNNGCPVVIDNKTVAADHQVKDTLYPVIHKQIQITQKHQLKRTVVKSTPASADASLANTPSYTNIDSTATKPDLDTVLGNATIILSYHATLVANEPATITLKLIPGQPVTEAPKQSNDQLENKLSFTQLNDSTASCTITNIQAFQRLKINASCNQSAIELIPANSEEQNLDMEKGNNWQWQIKALTNKTDSAQISLAVNGFKADGAVTEIATHQLKIKVDSGKQTNSAPWLAGLWRYVLSGLAIFFIFFLVILRRKKNKKDGGQPQ